jgi:spore coat protein CotH
MRFLTLILSLFALSNNVLAQKLPSEYRFSQDGKRLLVGNTEAKGFYDVSSVKVIELIFADPNYWTTLTNNKAKDIDLAATMIYDGDTLKSIVGVRFKGQTSYSGGPGGGGGSTSQKKSFNISLDFENPDLDIDGYKTFNLNNSFQDASFMKEVVYLNQAKQHLHALKSNFVQLKINGQNWGVYQNVQQLNSDYIKEWFMSNDGIRWRALRVSTTGGGGGGFGAGTSSLNNLGADTAKYKTNYTLKSTKQLFPWTKLAKVCEKLNTTPKEMLEDTISKYMDLDRTLWFLATEIAFGDDDSSIGIQKPNGLLPSSTMVIA